MNVGMPLRSPFLPSRPVVLIATTMVLACTAPAAAQVFADVATTAATEENVGKKPFQLPAVPNDVKEALDDFARLSKRGTWEKAFEALEKVRKAKTTGYLPDKDGFAFPLDRRVQQVLAEMPAAGRDAYRLFHDAEAKRLLAEASGPLEADRLRQVMGSLFFTAVGDQAADRLGNLLFEEGRFQEAADCWKAVFDHRPDSAIPRVQLLTKLALAWARAGRHNEFRNLVERLKERHAGETVLLGGANVDPVAYLEKLATGLPKISVRGDPDEAPAITTVEYRRPAESEPLWQHKYYAKPPTNPNQPQQMNPWDNEPLETTFLRSIPAATVDSDRVYVNQLGLQFALDLKTGKLAWRTSRLHDIFKGQNQQNFNRWGMAQGQSAVAPRIWRDGDKLWCLSSGQPNNPQQGAPKLVALDPATGKQVWGATNASALNTWPLAGAPIIVGDRMFFGSIKRERGTELYAVCLRISDGKVLWNTNLGAFTVDPNQMMYSGMPQPRLLLAGEQLFVDSHIGVLAHLDAGRGTLHWAHTYESEPPPTDYWNWYYRPPSSSRCGPLLLVDGVLYQKGVKSSRLYAYRLDGPSVAWQRPINQEDALVAIDGERMYVGGGDEMSAVDRATRAMQWGYQGIGNATVPLETKSHLLFFTPRGLFAVDKRSGEVGAVFRGADLESLGGRVLLAPTALISVSNLAVTAYALPPGPATANRGTVAP